MFEEINDYSALDWAKLLLIIGAVVLIGLSAVNQFSQFKYNAEFLTTPCELCLELNPKIELCPVRPEVNFTSAGFLTLP